MDMANDVALVAPSEGQAQPASNEQSQAPVATESENVAKLHKLYAKKEQELKGQLQNAFTYQQQLQQRLDQMEQQSAPDDYARLEIALRQAQQREQLAQTQLNQHLYAQQQAEQQRTARDRELQRLAEKYGVAVADLEKANDYDEAVEMAIEAKQRKRQQTDEEKEAKREANRPDAGGGGGARTPLSKWEQDYADATARKDSVAQQRLLRTRPTKGG